MGGFLFFRQNSEIFSLPYYIYNKGNGKILSEKTCIQYLIMIKYEKRPERCAVLPPRMYARRAKNHVRENLKR